MGVMCIGACGSDDPAKRAAACDDRGWAVSTPGEVVCPGDNACGCSGGDVCCVALNSSGTQVINSECVPAAQCQDAPVACDGPEDCGGGEVCCVTNSSAECTTEANCFGIQEGKACHSTSDCSPLQQCIPSKKAPYDGLTAVCG